ncbi:MAG: transglutaminase domain-containing protein, partial [Lachnospiraceae bacterium]|nr:transglutaminase domain-containing protein [Lachnospiraceae bacterium]
EYGVDNIAEDISALLGKDSSHLFQMEWARLYDDSFTPEYLPAPYGIITDDRPFRFLVYYKELFDGVVYRVRSGILEDDFYFYEADRSLYDLAEALHFSSREYLDFLDSEGDREEALRLKEDYERAIEDYSDQSNISEKLTELSRQIVADCHSDLEKARKLERYFTENGFSYSLSYVPSDNSVDYFVFESKTGYCAGYATAMTLMARAVGLPARYVEGFAAYEKDENGDFIIRDAHAHAFVEVYIPGAGWMSFDPTVAGYRSAPEGLGRFFTKLFNMFDKIMVVAVVAALLLLFSLLERIKESFLRLSLPMKPVKERILSLYANLIRRLGGSAGMDFSAYTPDMLRDYLLRERGAVPEKLIALFEKTAFGGYDCSREEYREAYREYRRCYRYIRRAAKDRGPVHNP